MIPLLKLFRFEPIIGAWFGLFISIFTIFINYIVVKKLANKKIALISSFLISVSPIWIMFARDARFYFLVTIIFYPFLFYFYEVIKNNKDYFKFGLTYSLFFHFHYSPILFVPVLIYYFWIKRKATKIKNYLYLIVGFIFPQTPLIIYDFGNRFKMLTSLFLWTPYRILGFAGFIPKNNFSIGRFMQSILATEEFIGKTFFYNKNLFLIITIIILAAIIISFIRYLILKKYNFIYTFCYLSFFLGLVGIYIHGDVPVHYFLPLFSVLVIISSKLLLDLYEGTKSFYRGLIIGFVILIIYLNTKYLIKYYSGFNASTFLLNQNFVSLNLQKRIAQHIVNDSQGQKYSLTRVGPDDQFEENYSQNYKYLLWLYGNEPVEQSNINYTIYEEFDNNIAKMFNSQLIDGILILKNEK